MGQNRSKCSSTNNPTSPESEEDYSSSTTSSTRRRSKSSSRSSTDKMSFFKKQSDEAKRRFEYQMHLAEDNPEPIFDISNSECSEIPSNVYSLCKVLNKEILLVHTNWLTSLKATDCNTGDLATIRVLDAHNNSIKSLPEDINKIHCLQVLNLEENKLKKIPESIGKLKYLQSLNLRGNKLKELPVSICDLPSLRTLDISHNQIKSLPKGMWHVRTLENLIIDAEEMIYPPAEICIKGTEAVMKFLCEEAGEEYLPASQFVLQVLESSDAKSVLSSTFSDNSLKMLAEDAKIMQNIEKYTDLQAKKRQERMLFSQQYEEDEKEHAKLAATAHREKDHLVSVIAYDQMKLNQELQELTSKKELDRQNLVLSLKEIEDGASKLLDNLIEMNVKAQKQEELMEAIERERNEQDQYYVVKYEEIANLRRKEVLDRMEEILNSSAYLEHCRLKHDAEKKYAAKHALQKELNTSSEVDTFIKLKTAEQNEMVGILTQQEELQKAAFEALLMQKDSRHSRVTNQINLIEKELAQLTVVEMERKELKVEMEMNLVAEKRIALTEMLVQLIAERDKREDQLKKRLVEMEEQRLQDQTDYWLVQYQRLMDRKPQALVDQEYLLEIPVLKILEQAEARDYVPLFARHRITLEVLCNMTEADLRQMGVHEIGLCKAIKLRLDKYMSKKVVVEEEEPMVCQGAIVSPEPSAPYPESEEAEGPSTSPIKARGLHSECSICLDKPSDIIFLNCGHVCCCYECGVNLDLCPLCRSNIVQKIQLQNPS